MNPNLTDWESDWDDDLPPEPEEVYQDLVRALKRKSGFGLFFVQCTPAESDRFIAKLPQDIPQKKVAVLRLVQPIDNLYQRVAEFVKDKQVDILLIKGLEYSLYKYEQRSFGEITEGQFSNLTRVPPILNHLNQQRERFRDDFPFCFVFLLRSFSINYLIHRAPDFFDWRSGVFELPTTPEVVEKESSRLLKEADFEEYLKLSTEQKIEKVLEIQELLAEQHQTESRKADLLLELGNLLITAEEYQQAIASYDQTLKIKPDYHSVWYIRGIALGALKRYEEAIASYDQALKIKPDDDSAWYMRGIALRYLKRYKEAIASYDQALKIKPDDDSAWYMRGIALRYLKCYQEAIASYDKAIEIKPDDSEAWIQRGLTLLIEKNIPVILWNFIKQKRKFHEIVTEFAEPLVSFTQPLQFNYFDKQFEKIKIFVNLSEPIKTRIRFITLYSIWYTRGIALQNLGRFEEAIASYDQALKFKPDKHEAWNNRGIALQNLGRFEEAIASYDQALKFKPDYDLAWYNRGYALGNLGRYEEAIASYDQALKFKPDYDWAWNNRGIVLRNLGRYEEAIASYDQALKFKPDKDSAWYNKACSYALQGNIEQAIENLEKAIHLNPDEYRKMVKNDSDFDSIREDERFVALIQGQHTGD